MDNQENRTATAQIDLLTEQVDKLIDACGRLQEELDRERQDLLGRNREAKLRIDQVVERLRELDAG